MEAAVQPAPLSGRHKVQQFFAKPAVRRNLEGYLLISPWLLGLLFFTLGPMVASLILSFTDWDIVREIRFIGMANYRRAFTQDRFFWLALYNTFYYVVGSVPLRLVLALGLALLLNQGLPGVKLFRTIFYLPAVTSMVAMAFLWQWILQPRNGLFNVMLAAFGIPGPGWLSSPDWAKPALILISLMYLGPQMVVFLAGLKGIPETLYEAADIDGAGTLAKFFRITLPMLSPTIFFNLVTSVISAFQVFTFVYVIAGNSGRGPMNSTLVYAMYIYEEAFRLLHMGYASALAYILFLIVLGLTLLQLRYSKWVYYEGEQ
jgi:multiple sugar transport system permease protein